MKARGFRPVSRGIPMGRGTRPQGSRTRYPVSAVRHDRCTGLLPQEGLPGSIRSRRGTPSATLVRRLCKLRPGIIDQSGAGHGKLDQPKLPWTVRTWPGLAREPAHRGCQRHRRKTRFVRRTAAATIRIIALSTSPMAPRRMRDLVKRVGGYVLAQSLRSKVRAPPDTILSRNGAGSQCAPCSSRNARILASTLSRPSVSA